MNTDPVESIEPIEPPPAVANGLTATTRDTARMLRAQGATLQEIADCMGLTRQRIHQLVTGVLKLTSPCRNCGKPTRAKICAACKSKTGYRRYKPCDCGCGQMVPINWRYTRKCLTRVLTEQSKSVEQHSERVD